jgi:cation diffusion facilitator CzcD-associated flavoprotein CzcO
LTSGEKLDADIIVTATGLQMQLFGAMQVTVNGKPVDVPSQYLWRFAMITAVPNFGNIIGYWHLSWTLGSDLSVRLFIRIIKRMNEKGYTSVVPELSAADHKFKDVTASPLTSTYVKNGVSSLPRCKDGGAWQQRPNYFLDKWRAETCDLNDGLKWEKVST